VVQTLARGPHAPRERFCVPYITQNHDYIPLATQPLHVTVSHHWSAGQYV